MSRSSPDRPHAPLEQDGMDMGHFTTRDTTITLYYNDLEIASNTREGLREHYEKQKTPQIWALCNLRHIFIQAFPAARFDSSTRRRPIFLADEAVQNNRQVAT